LSRARMNATPVPLPQLLCQPNTTGRKYGTLAAGNKARHVALTNTSGRTNHMPWMALIFGARV